jgi:t-SNARE complex subunit (syntaxin)
MHARAKMALHQLARLLQRALGLVITRRSRVVDAMQPDELLAAREMESTVAHRERQVLQAHLARFWP